MNVLMFSQDAEALREGSATYGRLKAYAETIGTLHVIVRAQSAGRMIVSDWLFLYPAAPAGLLGYIRAWHVGRMLCKKYRFDVISVQAPDLSGVIGFFLSRRFRVPLQLQLHTDYMSPYYRRAGWKERMQYMLGRLLIPRADCIRAVSERICRSLARPAAALPIYTDVRPFLDAKTDQETERRFAGFSFKMVAVGRFVEHEKNFLMLMDMMRGFIAICPDAVLVIVGDGPDRYHYVRRIAKYGLEKNIIIEPWRDDLPSFLKSFDLFLLSSNYEGWSRAVVEAMAAGLPVVMTDVGLAGEVVKTQENGMVVPVGDAVAMFEAVRDLWAHPLKRMKLADAARATVQEKKAETYEHYLTLYKSALVRCTV